MNSPRPPRELLFGNPERAAPKLSPDGRTLAYLAPDQGVLNVWAGPLDGQARPVTGDRGRGVRAFLWAEDSATLLYLQDKDGDENWHLYRCGLRDRAARDLTPQPGVQARLIATHWRFPDRLLVALNARDARAHDAHCLDLRTGELRLEAENPGDVIGWLADPGMKLRCAKAMRPDGGGELRVREEGGAWRALLSWGPDEQAGAHGFTPDGQSLYVESNLDSDATRLWEWPLGAGAPRLLTGREGADLAGVLVHPKDFHAEAAAFLAERLEWVVLDPGLRPDFEALAAGLSGDFSVVSRDDADRRWIIQETTDTKPVRYHLYDRRSRRLDLLFSSRPKLEEYELRPMKPVTITARDGLRLPCYLTTPPGPEGARAPCVLLVHGGPWTRDQWGFNPEVQWLAGQGCAVLQVNFRGSSGFGKRHLHAGDREWGAKMQDDLTDAAAWAVSRGLADPARIGIFGASYGGYAALAGAAFTPDLYRCAVDVVGPSNLVTLIRSIPPYWEPMKRIFDLRVGRVDAEEGFLKSRSPLFAAERIRVPLLVAQGAHDPRVKRAESERIVESLRAKGKPVEYLLFEDEGHGFARPENRLKFYERAEAFLAEHLGLAAAPGPGAAAPEPGAAA